jgi:hypothetical protein
VAQQGAFAIRLAQDARVRSAQIAKPFKERNLMNLRRFYANQPDR